MHGRRLRRKIPLRFRINRMHVQRGLQLLPNLFTLGNAFFGFCSIIFSGYGDFIAASYFILLGALMDALDGRIARFVRVNSTFGMHLDSLCDGISFGLAPAILMYNWQLSRAGALGFMACAFFLMAGLLRLARFNVTVDLQTTFSTGVPITLAGCFLAVFHLNIAGASSKPSLIIGLLLLITVLSGLMVSRIPFPTFKHVSKKAYAWGIVTLMAFLITMGFTKMLLVIFIGYFIFSIEESLRAKIQTP